MRLRNRKMSELYAWCIGKPDTMVDGRRINTSAAIHKTVKVLISRDIIRFRISASARKDQTERLPNGRSEGHEPRRDLNRNARLDEANNLGTSTSGRLQFEANQNFEQPSTP